MNNNPAPKSGATLEKRYWDDMEWAEQMEEKIVPFVIKKMAQAGLPVKKYQSIPKTNKELQYKGIDRILYLQSGKIFKIEEKIRTKDWGDILIEIIADPRYADFNPDTGMITHSHLRGIGWIYKDYSCELIAFFHANTEDGHIFSWKKFQKVYFDNIVEWYDLAVRNKNGFALKEAKNKDFSSHNIAIPKKAFFDAYKKIGGQII
jgi:hypothetical protein